MTGQPSQPEHKNSSGREYLPLILKKIFPEIDVFEKKVREELFALFFSRNPELFFLPPFCSPNFQRNNERREASKVHREREVNILGDLNGDADELLGNLEALGLIQEGSRSDDLSSIQWIGGNNIVVVLGDILGDKKTSGMKAMRILRHLEAQILEAGGEFVLLSGNHDDVAISFLTGTSPGGASDVFQNYYLSGSSEIFAGLAEFFRFSSDEKLRNSQDLRDFILTLPPGNDSFQKVVADILNNMKEDEEGNHLLNQICQKNKLVEYIDDSLFFHTDPTPQMLEYFLQEGKSVGDTVDEINKTYRDGLRAQLFGEGQVPANFQELKNVFLDPGNRTSRGAKSGSVERNGKAYAEILDLLPRLRAKGVNHIFHGHSPTKLEKNVFVSECGLKIMNADFFRTTRDSERYRSVFRMNRNAGISRFSSSENGMVPSAPSG